jgi:hypothetical protein
VGRYYSEKTRTIARRGGFGARNDLRLCVLGESCLPTRARQRGKVGPEIGPDLPYSLAKWRPYGTGGAGGPDPLILCSQFCSSCSVLWSAERT